MNAVPNVKCIHSTTTTTSTTTTQSVPNVKPSDKSSIMTTNTSSSTASASVTTSAVSSTGPIHTTNTAVSVDAVTGGHPQVHTVPTRRPSSQDTKPGSRKLSRTGSNTNSGVAYCWSVALICTLNKTDLYLQQTVIFSYMEFYILIFSGSHLFGYNAQYMCPLMSPLGHQKSCITSQTSQSTSHRISHSVCILVVIVWPEIRSINRRSA